MEALQSQRTFFTTRVSQMVLDGFLDREKAGHSFKREDSTEVLTSREREVIQLLAEGKTSKEVAVALNLSVKTAETHRTNLMRKLGPALRGRLDAIRRPQRHRAGVLVIPPAKLFVSTAYAE